MSFEATDAGLFLSNAVANAARTQVGAKADAVVALVSGQPRGTSAGSCVTARHRDGLQGSDGSLEIMNISGFQMQAQRQSVAIDHYVALAGFSRPRSSDFVAPFFAFT